MGTTLGFAFFSGYLMWRVDRTSVRGDSSRGQTYWVSWTSFSSLSGCRGNFWSWRFLRLGGVNPFG